MTLFLRVLCVAVLSYFQSFCPLNSDVSIAAGGAGRRRGGGIDREIVEGEREILYNSKEGERYTLSSDTENATIY